MCKKGWSILRIARELRCSDKEQIEQKRYRIEKAELTRLVEDGWSKDRMAEHFGCGPSTMHRRVQKYGLQTVRSRRVAATKRVSRRGSPQSSEGSQLPIQPTQSRSMISARVAVNSSSVSSPAS
jgi:hypothetical protein